MKNKNQKILIVGLGLIGGSIAHGLTSLGYEVGAITINKEDIEYALNNHIISSGEVEIKEDYIKQFDIVIFALYPHIFVDWLRQNQHLLKENAIITDATGVKKVVVEEIESFLRKDLDFVPAHPMAGREVSGIKNASKDIFKGANFIYIPRKNNKESSIEIIKSLAGELGFKNITPLSVDEHDEMIGFLSQLTHCIAVSLMTCKKSESLALFTGDSFRDLTRIARINEEMWSELFLLNKEKLLEQMDIFIKDFNKLRNAIENNDSETIKSMMIESTTRRGYFDKK